MTDVIAVVARELLESKRPVVVSGAGLSVPSGIPDFRSNTGIYSVQGDGGVDVKLLTRKTLYKSPAKFRSNFLKFYEMAANKNPNKAHYALADIVKLLPPDTPVIDQNVDGLSITAGVPNVHEVHGNIRECTCRGCKSVMPMQHYLMSDVCTCGGTLRPYVVLFGDTIPMSAAKIITRAQLGIYDYCLVLGTSMLVYPAASIIDRTSRGAIFDFKSCSSGYHSVQGNIKETLPLLLECMNTIVAEG